MNHVEDFNLNERKTNTLRSLRSLQYADYSNENFLREVICSKREKNITVGKKYRLYAEFETDAMKSKKCFVVFTNIGEFIGFDSEYFLEEYQWNAEKKYNL